MKLITRHRQTDETAEEHIDGGEVDVEMYEVYQGCTFITSDGERLSVTMRDSGFEVHYYADFSEASIDGGWFAFKNGTVTPPSYLADRINGEDAVEGVHVPFDTHMDSKRLEAWNRASGIVEELGEKTSFETYSIVNGPFNISNKVTSHEQKVDLIIQIADWFLNKEEN